MIWPPAYTLKKSARARLVRLKTSVHQGLEIIVPLRFSQKHIPDILESNKKWIKKQLLQIEALLQTTDPNALPTEIALPAIHQTWKIQYVKTSHTKIQIFSRPQHEIVLIGNIDNKPLCRKALALWVKNLAKMDLPLRLQAISDRTSLAYSHVLIRGQRSRWGSCSSEKVISLNYKLLFLPADLVDHILIHELCHTVHLNHSTQFWRLVASFDPQWQLHSRASRRAEKFVPAWVDMKSDLN